MWVVVFMAVCSFPLLVMAGVCLWRDYQWDKQNNNEEAD
jgi:hypothetical protein